MWSNMFVININCNNCGNKNNCMYKDRTKELKQILEKQYDKNKYYNLGGYIKCAFYVSE